MLKETIVKIFERHGIGLNDIDKANEVIEFILLDNPAIIYPKSKLDGIFEIDWENQLMYIREYRKDVMYDELDRAEICFEFDNIQRISVKLDVYDYENALVPGSSKINVDTILKSYSKTKTDFDNEVKRKIDESYGENAINLAMSISIREYKGQYLSELLTKSQEIMTDIKNKTIANTQDIFDKYSTNLTKVKTYIQDSMKHIPIDSNTISTTLDNAFKTAIDIDLINDIFYKATGVHIITYISNELNIQVTKINLSIKYETELKSEVKLKFNTSCGLDSEMTLSFKEDIIDDELPSDLESNTIDESNAVDNGSIQTMSLNNNIDLQNINIDLNDTNVEQKVVKQHNQRSGKNKNKKAGNLN